MATTLSKANFNDWIKHLKLFLLDCDGVVWRGNTIIPGVPESIKKLRGLGIRVVFVSNNSTRSRADTLQKIVNGGIPCTKDDVITSSYVAPAYLKDIGFTKKTYIIGQSGLADEFNEAGLPFRGVDEHSKIPLDMLSVKEAVQLDKDIGAVVVGLDTRITYTKIAFALNHLEHNTGCLFIATNTDKLLPEAEGGLLCPGAGSIVKMLSNAHGKEPIVLGKPSKILEIILKQKYNLDPNTTCMVGDSLKTDIKFGLDCAFHTLLVLTGVTSQKDLDTTGAPSSDIIVPEMVVPSLGDVHLFID